MVFAIAVFPDPDAPVKITKAKTHLRPTQEHVENSNGWSERERGEPDFPRHHVRDPYGLIYNLAENSGK